MSTFIIVLAVVSLWIGIFVKWAQAATVAPWMLWQPSPVWLRQAACIHRHETFGLPPMSWASWHDTRNPISRGGMQFLPSTYRSVGGTGDPARASKREQLYRAWLLWNRDGGSWREWSTAGRCGLK